MEPSWKAVLQDEFTKPYFTELVSLILQDIKAGETVYPSTKNIFNAFTHTPFDKVNVVILGQDPYHGPNQAHGLCFSVSKGIRPPPSLKNIFKELHTDVNCTLPEHGELTAWADQGVLLLNAVLTVKQGKPASHANKGWEQFTDATIKALSDQREGIVFLLWGKYAQEKGAIIDTSKHHVLTSPHPSPFSADRGFFGCNHFSKTNALLETSGKKSIDWQIV